MTSIHAFLRLYVGIKEMTRRQKIIVGIGGFVLIAIIAVYFSPPAQFTRGMAVQMRAGKVVMDSLTDTDIQNWITRADKLLADQANNPQQFGDIPVPEDLKALKILRVVVVPPERVSYTWTGVSFMWEGGIDHTSLDVQTDSNGQHTVIARYTDKHEKQLWPK